MEWEYLGRSKRGRNMQPPKKPEMGSLAELTNRFPDLTWTDMIRNETLREMFNLSDLTENDDVVRKINKELYLKHMRRTDYACAHIWDDTEEHQTFMIATFAIIGIGLLGNGLSIGVFTSSNMRFISSNIYLLFRAISDSLYLIVIFLTRGLTTLRCLYFPDSYLDIFHRNLFMCKLLQYLMDLLSDFSCCLVLAFTVERFIACYKPFSYKHICTVARAKRMCFMLLLLIATSIFPSHVFLIGHTSNFQYCTVLQRYESTFTLLYMTEAIVYRIIPVITIAIVNILIICAFSSVNRRSGSTPKRDVSQTGSEYTKNSMSSLLASKDGGKGGMRMRRDVKQKQITLTLLLVSTAYLVTSVPALMHFLLFYLHQSGFVQIGLKTMDLYHHYGQLLYIAGFSVTFFLFTVTGTLYRNQLRLMLTCACLCARGAGPGTPLTQHRHSLRLTAVPNCSPTESHVRQPFNSPARDDNGSISSV